MWPRRPQIEVHFPRKLRWRRNCTADHDINEPTPFHWPILAAKIKIIWRSRVFEASQVGIPTLQKYERFKQTHWKERILRECIFWDNEPWLYIAESDELFIF